MVEAKGNMQGQRERGGVEHVVQTKLVLADFLEEVAGLWFGPCIPAQFHSLGLSINVILSEHKDFDEL